jgi:hypothetical protein
MHSNIHSKHSKMIRINSAVTRTFRSFQKADSTMGFNVPRTARDQEGRSARHGEGHGGPGRASTFSPHSMPRRRCVSLGSRRLALEVALTQIVVCLVLTDELSRACARCLPPGGQLFRRCFRRTARCGMLAHRPAALRPGGYLLYVTVPQPH